MPWPSLAQPAAYLGSVSFGPNSGEAETAPLRVVHHSSSNTPLSRRMGVKKSDRRHHFRQVSAGSNSSGEGADEPPQDQKYRNDLRLRNRAANFSHLIVPTGPFQWRSGISTRQRCSKRHAKWVVDFKKVWEMPLVL